MAKDKSIKNDGSYIFADFSKGLYLLETPRFITEQLASLALIDGRNVWAEKGALVPQYGYELKATLPPSYTSGETVVPPNIIAISKGDSANDDFMILANEVIETPPVQEDDDPTLSQVGCVYLYSASQGLKKYRTTVADGWTKDAIVTRRGKDLCIYDGGLFRLFGGNYIEETQDVVAIGLFELNSFTTYAEYRCSPQNSIHFWNGKLVLINNHEYVVTSCYKPRLDTHYTVRVVRTDGGVADNGTLGIYECATWTMTLTYSPDNTGVTPPNPDVTLVPKTMGVANNRLFVEHTDGNIYYSSVGIINDFDETHGAGYFGGFYNDTTKLLSIEDFLSGTLITKENGMYYLTISSSDGVKIDKISQVGQSYASDHVIVGEKVYAYDKNLGGIVNAISVNVFGALVAGKPLVTSEYLNVQNFNINSTKRALVYNAEAQVLVLYYGENLNYGIVYTMADNRLFPRQLDKDMFKYIGFNQGVMGVSIDGSIMQDFKKGTIIPTLSCVASFEPIGIRDNRFISSTILEITELNGIDYTVTTQNAGSSNQVIKPSFYTSSSSDVLYPFLYSDGDYLNNSFELTSRWAEQSSHMTRLYAPMSGRNGVSITLKFEPNKSFILSTLRLPDFSQGN